MKLEIEQYCITNFRKKEEDTIVIRSSEEEKVFKIQ